MRILSNENFPEDAVDELREAMNDPLFLEDLYEVMENFKYCDHEENNSEDKIEESRDKKDN
jgi:hypothetical protein